MNIVKEFQKTINKFFENIEEYKQSQAYRNFLSRITIQRNSFFSEHSSSDRRTKNRNTFTISIRQSSVEVNASKTLRFREKYDSNRFLTRIQNRTNIIRRKFTLDNFLIFSVSFLIESKNNFNFFDFIRNFDQSID